MVAAGFCAITDLKLYYAPGFFGYANVILLSCSYFLEVENSLIVTGGVRGMHFTRKREATIDFIDIKQ